MADKFMLASALVAFVGFSPANAEVAVASTSMGARAFARFMYEDKRMHNEIDASIANLTRHTTLDSAFQVLRKSRKVTPTMLSFIESSVSSSRTFKAAKLRAHAPSSLAQKSNPSGYAGVDSARVLLNQMLDEVNRKHDMETSRCSDFFKQQCALMETCRQDISHQNAMAAKCRGKVLDAQAEINICEKELPRLRYELASNIHECTERIQDLEAALKVVLEDIEVMTNVLRMTDCNNGSASLLQQGGLRLLKCQDRCRKERTFLSFEHAGIRKLMARLQPTTREKVQALLGELSSQEPAGHHPVVLLQDVSSPGPAEVYNVTTNITNFTNPPLPQEPVPGDPCEGITYDNGLGKGDCSVSSNPQCYKLQGKFLAIQTGIVDTRDELLANLKRAKESCAHTQKVIDEEIERYDAKHKKEQTLLAEATECENTAGEEGRMKNKEHGGLESALMLSREDCSTNLRTFESEMCSLKKIRGELYKMRGDNHPAFFQDCEVSPWEYEKCSVSCGGGTQKMTRNVVTHPMQGMACPPLEAFRSCNEHPCPIDCSLSSWGGWSGCSADCGGGVSQRIREIEVQPRYDGEPCEDTSETRQCNLQDCDKDCVLSKWSDWSECSKECGTGHREKHRVVLEQAVGAGKCPEEHDKKRYRKRKCNRKKCEPVDPTAPIKCQSKVDLVLVLDGSGSVGSAGWEATKAFASTLVRAFQGSGTDAMVSVILFSGPWTWSEYVDCVNGGSDGELPASCRVRMIQHFGTDLAATQRNIAALQWPMGTTITRVALQMAKAEVKLSRPDAQAVVLTVSDGLPLSPAMTGAAADELQKVARVMWAPVNLNMEGVGYMKKWASWPVEENLINIGSFEHLSTLKTIDDIVANICPNVQIQPRNYRDESLNEMYQEKK